MLDPVDEKALLLPLTHSTTPHVARGGGRFRIAALAAAVALVHVTVLFFYTDAGPLAACFGVHDEQVGIGLPEKITHRWGQYAPWFPAGTYTPPPSGCTIDQVHIVSGHYLIPALRSSAILSQLQRHGARHPTAEDDYARTVSRLQNATRYTSPKLAFLDDYKYTLGEEDLVSLGAQQSFDAGVQAWNRYALVLGLVGVNVKDKVFVRASDMSRVVDSAHNWSAGNRFPLC